LRQVVLADKAFACGTICAN